MNWGKLGLSCFLVTAWLSGVASWVIGLPCEGADDVRFSYLMVPRNISWVNYLVWIFHRIYAAFTRVIILE